MQKELNILPSSVGDAVITVQCLGADTYLSYRSWKQWQHRATFMYESPSPGWACLATYLCRHSKCLYVCCHINTHITCIFFQMLFFAPPDWTMFLFYSYVTWKWWNKKQQQKSCVTSRLIVTQVSQRYIQTYIVYKWGVTLDVCTFCTAELCVFICVCVQQLLCSSRSYVPFTALPCIAQTCNKSF